ncbi:MAG: phosphopantetheine-binding protein [Nocardioides sp.]
MTEVEATGVGSGPRNPDVSPAAPIIVEAGVVAAIEDAFPGCGAGLDTRTPLFNGGLSLNSTQMIELTLAVEDQFGIEFDPQLLTMENFATLGSLADLVRMVVEDDAAAAAASR